MAKAKTYILQKGFGAHSVGRTQRYTSKSGENEITTEEDLLAPKFGGKFVLKGAAPADKPDADDNGGSGDGSDGGSGDGSGGGSDDGSGSEDNGLTVTSSGRGKWDVVNAEGETLNDEFLTKAVAEAWAATGVKPEEA